MKKTVTTILFLALLFPLAASASPKAAYVWTELTDGFYYAKYTFQIGERQNVTIRAFKIDPKKYNFQIIRPDEKTSSARNLASASNALLVINGGFFTSDDKSIGLLANNGKLLNKKHNTSWWSIFSIKNSMPSIETPNKFNLTGNTEVAIQVGPRLVVNGKTMKLKESTAIRSALGITYNNMIVIAITSGYGISMRELSERMGNSVFKGGLWCKEAMALDGGSSSQIYVKVGKFEYSQPGLASVPNGLGVFKKK